MKKFFKVFFYCSGFSFLNAVLQVTVAIFFILLYIFLVEFKKILGLASSTALDINSILNKILMPVLITASILTFGIAWLAHIIFRRRFFERLSIQKTSWLPSGICFLTGVALQLPIGYIVGLVERTGIAPDIFQEYEQMTDSLMTDQSFILQILAIGLLAPLMEEIIFRGLIFHQLRKNIPLPIALILQAFLFGLAHLNIIQGSYAFLAGILMGISLIWSGSLLLPMLMHAGMNLSAVFLSHYGQHLSENLLFILTMVSFVLIPVCFVLLFRLTRGY